VKKPKVHTGSGQHERGEGNQAFASKEARIERMIGDHTSSIQALIDLLKHNNLAELELEREGFRIRLKRETVLTPPPSAKSESAAIAPDSLAEHHAESPAPDVAGMVTMTSPIVGTFYRSPSPEADPYVEEGDFVNKGQVLCIVEAMKLMNEIESEVDGRVVKILVESTKPVEYGQPLFLIDPSAVP